MALAFMVFSAGIIVSALAVVLFKNVFRASLMLVLCFFLVAGLFASLSADFLAAIQVLIYVGAISVLIILAIMLTREITLGSLTNKLKMPALVASGFVSVSLIFAILSTDWQVSQTSPVETTTPLLANLLFSPENFMLPLEMAAILLLVAIIGAIILVRDK
jgi:NADH:ubiquinone oxidoreductase subunit 6 (subunit J)